MTLGLKKDLETLRMLLPLFRFHPWGIPLLVVLGLLCSLADGLGITLFLPLLKTFDPAGTAPQGTPWLLLTLDGLFASVPPEDRIPLIAGCIFAALSLKGILSFLYGVLFGWLDVRVTHRLRVLLFTQLLDSDYRFFESRPAGSLLNTLTTETWRSSDALAAFVGILAALCTCLVYTGLLLLLSWSLTLYVLLFLLGISLVTRAMTRKVRNASRALTEENILLTRAMSQALSAMHVIRAFCRETYETVRFERVSGRISRLFLRLMVASGTATPLHETLAGALLLAMFFHVLHQREGISSLMVFIFVLYRLQPRVRDLDEGRVRLISLSGSLREVTELLSRTRCRAQSGGGPPFRGLTGPIRFEDVAFSYGEGLGPALVGLNFEIPPGKITAVVGPSGSGKSTLIKLLLRFYAPSRGRIYMGPTPLASLDIRSWRGGLALVSQDVYLFSGTLRENIAYGNLEATDAEIEAAAEAADAHAFITRLPLGYDTPVGEGGVLLSGGERQRVALARAMVRNPEILILDEATSELDTLSEATVHRALKVFCRGRMVIAVAHRVSTVRLADHILVLEKGRLVEQGPLEDLLAAGKLFAELFGGGGMSGIR